MLSLSLGQATGGMGGSVAVGPWESPSSGWGGQLETLGNIAFLHPSQGPQPLPSLLILLASLLSFLVPCGL